MNFLKKSKKSIVALSLCLCTILSVTAMNASAAETEKVMEYATPISDCKVFVYSTEGGSVECTKATNGFLMETGVRVYKATPKEGYKFDGWSYTLTLNIFGKDGNDKGNRNSLGRYTFSKVENNKVEYDGKNEEIQLNRLTSCCEFAPLSHLRYTITANFSEI